jgi:hypothetical protein
LRGLTYRAKDGAWLARRAPAQRGGRTVSVRAPVDELPLFVRAGAILPLLTPDVDTLAPRRGGGVRLADRAGRLRLLAFPRGRSEARIYDSEEARSRLTAHEWTLTLTQTHKRRVQVEAVLPWHACGARTSHGVTRVTRSIRSGRIRIMRCP